MSDIGEVGLGLCHGDLSVEAAYYLPVSVSSGSLFELASDPGELIGDVWHPILVCRYSDHPISCFDSWHYRLFVCSVALFVCSDVVVMQINTPLSDRTCSAFLGKEGNDFQGAFYSSDPISVVMVTGVAMFQVRSQVSGLADVVSNTRGSRPCLTTSVNLRTNQS